MANDPKRALSGAGFYAVLVLCVLAVGIGGYALLFGGTEPAVPEEPAPQPEVAVQMPEQEPAVEAVSPAETPAEPPAEPAAPPVDDTPVVAAVPQLVVSPLRGEVTAAFSVDQLVYSETLADWRTHDGIDIAAAAGTTVLAASAGTVLSVSDDPLMGTTVVLDHGNGCQTTYASLQSKPPVKEGASVTTGQIIGAVGVTAAAESAQGPHLHFSVTQDGDAIDPEEYLRS